MVNRKRKKGIKIGKRREKDRKKEGRNEERKKIG